MLFLLKSRDLPPHMKELDYIDLVDFFNYECELYLKQLLAPFDRKTIVAYHTSTIDLPLKVVHV